MLHTYIASVCSQTYVAIASVFILMLHMFHTYVAHILSGCCVCLQWFLSVFMCFTPMLQVFHTDVEKVDRDVHMLQWFIHVCFKCLFPMFHLLFSDLCCKCVYLDVAYFSHMCCKCFIWMLRMFAMVFKCFLVFLQVFQTHVSIVSSVSRRMLKVLAGCFKSRSGVASLLPIFCCIVSPGAGRAFGRCQG